MFQEWSKKRKKRKKNTVCKTSDPTVDLQCWRNVSFSSLVVVPIGDSANVDKGGGREGEAKRGHRSAGQ